MKRNEIIILVALIGFSAACLLSSSGGSALILKDENLPAHVYSNILAGLLAAVSIFRIIMLARPKMAGFAGSDAPAPAFSKSALLIAGCSIFYTLGITYVGFYVSTFLCMFVLYLGFENWEKAKVKVGLVFSLGLCLVFYVSFYFLKIYLPDGLLF
jgi:hypothetical protein